MFVKRYLVAELRDGRLLALDKASSGAVLLTPKQANGDYKLSRCGVLQLRAGAIVSARLPAESTGYRIAAQRGGRYRVIRIAEPAWELPIGGSPGAPSGAYLGARFAILDLKPSGYLLAKSDGISELQAATAPTGSYPIISGNTITVRNGTAADAPAGNPIFQYADDFARKTATGVMAQAACAHLTWRIKASTFCNLRCRYCYEWDRLADSKRLSIADWCRIYRAASEHRSFIELQLGRSVALQFVLHGGEPFLLPLDYLDAVLTMQHEFIGHATPFGIQTNLAVLSGEMLGLLNRNHAVLSVSWDGVPDARLDLAGHPSNQRVLRNIARLREKGVCFGVSLVLGTHNASCLPAIYDRLEALGASWLSVIPMFESSTPKTTAAFMLPHEAKFSRAGRPLRALAETRPQDAFTAGLPHFAIPGRRYAARRGRHPAHHGASGLQRELRRGNSLSRRNGR